MDTLLTGSKNNILRFSGKGLVVNISGDIREPFSDKPSAESASRVECNLFASNSSSELSILDAQPVSFVGSCYEEKTRPLFFEQTPYTVSIVVEIDNEGDAVQFWHENKYLREAVKEVFRKDNTVFLSGTINFRNDIGFSDFYIWINGEPVLKLGLEVYPSKIDYKKDYYKLLEDVTNEVYNLAFDYFRNTYQEMQLEYKKNPTLVEFFQIISMIYEKLLKATDQIISNAHHELEVHTEMLPVHKVRNFDSTTVKWMNKHPEKAFVRNDGRLGFERVQTTRKYVNYDTNENRLVKFILKSTEAKLRNLYKLWGRDDQEILSRIEEMSKQIHRRNSFTFLKNVNDMPSNQSMSLVFAMAPGYKELYKYYLMLQKGLSLNSDIFHISMKDTALLYEYWCFIKLNRILRDSRNRDGRYNYQLISDDTLKVDRKGLAVTLKKGVSSKVKYRNVKNGEQIVLSYNESMGKLPTVPQKPDNVLSLEKNNDNTGSKYEYVFDAKYRIETAYPYSKEVLSPGPKEEDINTMHRYRDAIVYERAGTDETYDRKMFGAYVLFPYSNENEYREHKYYKSIDKVNVGGLPFLPGTTGMVEKFLEQLIAESSESAFERATLPKGIEDRLINVDLKNRNVLVGMVRDRKQFDICIDNNFYYIPADKVAEERLPLEYVAIHQTKEQFGEEAGIRYFGRVKAIKKVRRKSIPVPYKEKNADKEYYLFDITEWKELDNKIEADRARMHYYTNNVLLECCARSSELSIESEGQLRLYKELRRYGAKAQESKDNTFGFTYDNATVFFADGKITVTREDDRFEYYSMSTYSKRPKELFRMINDYISNKTVE